MKRKEQVLSLLKQQLPSLKQNFKVKSIGIFGSYAREEQTEKSDIDLLVEFEAPVGFFSLTLTQVISLYSYPSNRIRMNNENKNSRFIFIG